MKKSLALKYVGLIGAVLAILLCYAFTLDGLSVEGMHTLGVLIATLLLLIFETFNVPVTCLLSICLLYYTGCVSSMPEAFSGYANHTLYFVLASFGISFAMQKSILMEKLFMILIRYSRQDVKGIIKTFMITTAILSAFMSNVAAVILLIPFARKLSESIRNEEERKRTFRTMIICIALSAMIGGLATPAGSSINLLTLDILKAQTGYSVRFIDWILIGAPFVAFLLTAAYLIVTRVYPPAELKKEQLEGFLKSLSQSRALSGKDLYILIVVTATILLWILSSWFPQIHITVVAVVCLALFFVPGYSVLTWEEYNASISWPTFFIAGTMISVAGAVTGNGLAQYLTERLLPASFPGGSVLLCGFVALVTIVFMLFVPVAPAAITVLCPIVILFSQNVGVDPLIPAITCSFCVCNGYLFPLDTPMVVAYDQKAFTMFELPKATIWVQLVLIVLIALWMPFICRFIL